MPRKIKSGADAVEQSCRTSGGVGVKLCEPADCVRRDSAGNAQCSAGSERIASESAVSVPAAARFWSHRRVERRRIALPQLHRSIDGELVPIDDQPGPARAGRDGATSKAGNRGRILYRMKSTLARAARASRADSSDCLRTRSTIKAHNRARGSRVFAKGAREAAGASEQRMLAEVARARCRRQRPRRPRSGCRPARRVM